MVDRTLKVAERRVSGSGRPLPISAQLLHRFPMQCQVETFPFYLLCHAKPNKDPDHGQNDQAGYGAIAEDDCNTNALVKELSDVALEHAGRATVLFDGKDS